MFSVIFLRRPSDFEGASIVRFWRTFDRALHIDRVLQDIKLLANSLCLGLIYDDDVLKLSSLYLR
jgi:hypothetical protein